MTNTRAYCGDDFLHVRLHAAGADRHGPGPEPAP